MVISNELYSVKIEIDMVSDPLEAARILREMADSLSARGFKLPLYANDSRDMVKLQRYELHGNGALRLYDLE